jgi:hypothetical protein
MMNMTTTTRMAKSCCLTTIRVASWNNQRSAVRSFCLLSQHPPSFAPRTLMNDSVYFSSSSDDAKTKSPFASNNSSLPKKKQRPRRKLKFVPQKAAVALTPKARNFFRALLESTSDEKVIGIILNYHQSSTGEPRMVFSFDFVKEGQLMENDEGCVASCCVCRWRVSRVNQSETSIDTHL